MIVNMLFIDFGQTNASGIIQTVKENANLMKTGVQFHPCSVFVCGIAISVSNNVLRYADHTFQIFSRVYFEINQLRIAKWYKCGYRYKYVDDY